VTLLPDEVVPGSPLGYTELAPPPRLREAVECVWVRRAAGSPGGSRVGRQRVMPDGCADLVFDLSLKPALGDGRVTGLRAIAVGAMTAPLLVEERAGSIVVGVRFHPGRAPPFLAAPLDELTDRRVALEALWGEAAPRLVSRLLAGRRPADWLAALDGELAAFGSPDPDPVVSRAASWIAAGGGRARIGELAPRLGISRQALARRFRRHVGLGPKAFARVVRMRAAVARVERCAAAGARVDWAALALEQGFFDQAHLCAELRVLAGLRPTSLLRRPAVPDLQDADGASG
jgi:AraC-like DNA-binding protein